MSNTLFKNVVFLGFIFFAASLIANTKKTIEHKEDLKCQEGSEWVNYDPMMTYLEDLKQAVSYKIDSLSKSISPSDSNQQKYHLQQLKILLNEIQDEITIRSVFSDRMPECTRDFMIEIDQIKASIKDKYLVSSAFPIGSIRPSSRARIHALNAFLKNNPATIAVMGDSPLQKQGNNSIKHLPTIAAEKSEYITISDLSEIPQTALRIEPITNLTDITRFEWDEYRDLFEEFLPTHMSNDYFLSMLMPTYTRTYRIIWRFKGIDWLFGFINVAFSWQKVIEAEIEKYKGLENMPSDTDEIKTASEHNVDFPTFGETHYYRLLTAFKKESDTISIPNKNTVMGTDGKAGKDNQQRTLILEDLWYGKVGHICNLGVIQEYKRKGMGEALINKVIEFSKTFTGFRYPIERINLNVISTNEAAIKLYKKLGWIETSYRQNYYSLSRIDPEKRWDALFLSYKLVHEEATKITQQ